MTNMTTAPINAPITIQPMSVVCGLMGSDVVGLYRTSAPRMTTPIAAPSSDLRSDMIVSNVLLGKTGTFAKDISSGCCT